MKTKIILIAVIVLVCACAANRTQTQYELNPDAGPGSPYPDVSFAVISDLHVYDHSLGITGAAFEKAMSSDRKLLPESIELLEYMR